MLGWIKQAAGVEAGSAQAIRAANAWLRIVYDALRHIAAYPPPRFILVSNSPFSVPPATPGQTGGVVAVQPTPDAPRANLLTRGDHLARMQGVAASAAQKKDLGAKLACHLIAACAAMGALRPPPETQRLLLPQYEYLAGLVAAARRAMPDLVPPFVVRVCAELARDLAAPPTAKLAAALGEGLSLALEVVLPADAPRGGSGPYDFVDFASPPPGFADSFFELDKLDRAEPITLKGFALFSTAARLGFEALAYAAHVRLADGAFFWITKEHAARIGGALRPTLRSLALQLTMLEAGAGDAMLAALPAGIELDELTVSHKSGDEVTLEEARWVAGLATRTRARRLRLWAGEFVAGALDELTRTLAAAGNLDLVETDVCDVSRPEPEDKIAHPPLAALVAANRSTQVDSPGPPPSDLPSAAP